MNLPPEPPSTDLAAALFRTRISGPVVQTQCAGCHVETGNASETQMVFLAETAPDHGSVNFGVFENFLAQMGGGADLILDKIQGVGHDGGVVIVPGSEDYLNVGGRL